MTNELTRCSGRPTAAWRTAEAVSTLSHWVGSLQTRFVTVGVGLHSSRTDLPCNPMHCIAFQLAQPKQHREVGCTEGNFQAYIEDLKKRKGPDADQPHRVTYRKLVRG